MTPSDAQRIEQLIQQLRKIAEWEHSYDAEHAIDEAVDLIEQQQREIERLRVDAEKVRELIEAADLVSRDATEIEWEGGPTYEIGSWPLTRLRDALAATAPKQVADSSGRAEEEK